MSTTPTLCIPIPAMPDPPSITLPGGVELQHINLMDLVQPALAPLVPIFDVVDAIVAVFNALKAIPETIGPPPDPAALARVMPELGQKVNKLVALMPQLAIPKLIIGIIDLIIDTLRQARSVILNLQQQMVQVTGAIDRARDLDDANLTIIGNCSKRNVEQEAANVGKSLASLGRLIELVNVLMGMIGGPEIPSLSGVAGRPLDEAVEPIDSLIEVLVDVRSAVPLP